MYSYIDNLTAAQVEQLHQLYQREWWSEGRGLADIRTMLANTNYIFGVCKTETQQLAAFARVLTDGVYRALVFDVIVSPDFRGQGLGQGLIQHITAHPDLSQVECIQLFCKPEMVPFYEKNEFEPSSTVLMVRQVRQDQEVGKRHW